MSSRLLNDLDPRFRPQAFELIARACEQGTPVIVLDTLRTAAEQATNVANGVSSTFNSKHLAQPPDGKSLAIDICPYDVYQLHGPDKLKWDTTDPAWLKLGLIGESLGLRWGGRWHDPHDPGHFEYVKPNVIQMPSFHDQLQAGLTRVREDLEASAFGVPVADAVESPASPVKPGAD